ncbi:MAG: HEAT repeat domain-containing protein [Planctomycetota bacterium]
MRPLIVCLLFFFAPDLSSLTAQFERERGEPYAVRIQTVNAIAALDTEPALRFLVSVVGSDKDNSIRLNTVYSIARMSLPSAAKALVTFWDEGDESLRNSVLSAYTSYRKEALPAHVLEQALTSSNSGMRSNVIRYLGRRNDPRFDVEAERYLTDFPNSGTSLISTLTQSLTPRGARLLLRIYDDTRKYDRDQVPKAFSGAEKSVLHVLFEAIASDDDGLTLTAATIARRAGISDAAMAMVERLRRSEGELAAVLIEAIGAVGGKSLGARDAILTALSGEDVRLVIAAIRALRGVPIREAIPALIEFARSGDKTIRVEAQVTLERITGQQFGDRADLWEKWWKEYGGDFSFEDVKKPDPASFDQALVNLAIEKGAAALKAIRKEDTPWEYGGHPVGTTALVVLALRASGLDPKKDRDLRAGLEYIVKAPTPQRTYDAGIVAMALEACGGKRFKRKIAACAKWLVENQKDSGIWGYPNGNGDNSNSQYAVLGLRAAAKAGVKVPQRTWRRATDHFLGTQIEDGSWSYVPGPNVSAGSTSMTAAGVASLLVCLENLNPGKGDAEDDERKKILAAIDRGFSALGEKMKIDTDSLYALYGIERAGVLGRRGGMGGKAWYAPGATRLVEEQDRRGFWTGGYNEPVQTAFAILFLKKFTAPIATK